MEEPRRAWRDEYERLPVRAVPFETMSGIPVEPVYGDAPFPGQFPYTRGPYASMYRSKLWTMRMFAGFGTPADTNERFRALLDAGATGLSTAFDLPTLMGRDSDDPWSVGEVGKAGVAVCTLTDMEDLFAGIDLGSVTTSMTINGPAAVLMAMYVAVGDRTGVPRAELAGTIQNDILKEYQAQKEYLYPPRPSMRLVTDVMRFTTTEMPRWHPVSISGYHIREAGSTAAQELAFTLANGFAYVEAARAAGLDVDEFAPRLSFFFNSHIDFFEEIGKFRAARRIWARWMRDEYGAVDERSLRHAIPRADVGRVPHRPAAREQHRPRRARRARRGAGWRTVAAHRQLRRGARAAVGQGGAHRPAHAADHRRRDRRGPRRRSARRFGLRGVDDRRDWSARPRRSSLDCATPATDRCSKACTPASTTDTSSARSRTPPTASSPASRRVRGSSSESTRLPTATTARRTRCTSGPRWRSCN